MSELFDAIQEYRNTLTTIQRKRELMAIIYAILASLTGFPVPPNAPNPETASEAELDAYVDLVEAAIPDYEASQGGGN